MVRRYAISIGPCTLRLLTKALESLNMEVESPVEVSTGVVDGVKTIRVELVKSRKSCIEALVRVSYRVGGGSKCWSDLYLLALSPEGNVLKVDVRRISGVGRTDPDSIVDSLARAITLLQAREEFRV